MTGKINTELIIRTKLHRPQISNDHLHREHLLDRLNGCQNRPVILVSAPAGYGKSTLVSCWLKDCDVPSTWVSLDKNDNDLRLFLFYFISAIQHIYPIACGESLSMLKGSHLPPVSVLAKRLINELDQNKKFILVLDDYHLIRDKNVHGLVAKLLAHPSTLIQLVLIARRDPPLPLTSLRAKRQMAEIRTQDLRFSMEETTVFLQQMTGVPIDKSVAAILEKKTEGWVTGLRLAVLSLRHRENFKRIITNLPVENRYVMDYIISEILSHQPSAVQEYMLKTSILSRFCASLCSAVCYSNADSSTCKLTCNESLGLLDKANLFVIPLDDKREWFRYHHLFQALLKRQLKKRFKPEDIAKLYKLASTWFAENGYIEEAFLYALESGDEAGAAQLVKQHRLDIMNREQWYLLDRWLKKFTLDFIHAHPDLLLAKAWVYQRQARYSQLFNILDKLESSVSERNKESITDKIFWGEVKALKSFQFYSTTLPEQSEAFAREALENLSNRNYSVRGFTLIILSLALQMQGDSEQSQRVVYEALRQEEASVPNYKSTLLAALCFANWIAADLNNLKLTAIQLFKHGQKCNLPETVSISRYFAGIFHYQRNELDMAESFLVQVAGNPGGRELTIPSIVTYCQSSIALSLTYQAMGRAKEASEVAETAVDYMLETSNIDMLEICKAFQADLALLQGRVTDAEFWARNVTPKPFTPSYRFYTPHLTLPKVLLARRTAKSLSEAESLLSQLYEYYVPIYNTRILIDVLVLQALLSLAQDNESKALKKVAEALSLAEPGGFVRPFIDTGPEMADLLRRLVKQNPAKKYARQILETFDSGETESFTGRPVDQTKQPSSLPEAVLIEPLTNREIEVLKVLAKGMSNNEIAESMYISTETVKRHLSTIYRKLEVKNRHQSVIRAKSIGIL